jgi:hypothetical protein
MLTLAPARVYALLQPVWLSSTAKPLCPLAVRLSRRDIASASPRRLSTWHHSGVSVSVSVSRSARALADSDDTRPLDSKGNSILPVDC